MSARRSDESDDARYDRVAEALHWPIGLTLCGWMQIGDSPHHSTFIVHRQRHWPQLVRR